MSFGPENFDLFESWPLPDTTKAAATVALGILAGGASVYGVGQSMSRLWQRRQARVREKVRMERRAIEWETIHEPVYVRNFRDAHFLWRDNEALAGIQEATELFKDTPQDSAACQIINIEPVDQPAPPEQPGIIGTNE